MLSLNIDTGELRLNSYVTSNMQGYMMFNVVASDMAGHTDVTSVKIFIVSEKNRVKFVFLSDIEVIRRNEKFVSQQVIRYISCQN